MPVSSRLLSNWQVGRRPILILGHGRSGTSWVGSVLAAARRVLYYFEPLHPAIIGRNDLSNWFRYARPGKADVTLEQAFDPVFAGLPSASKRWNRGDWHRWLPGYRVAVKDVAALMAAEWLHDRYRPQMLFIVRHPCPVILSELRQGTPPGQSLKAILGQDQLIEDHLQAYVGDLEQADGAVEQLAAVWAARYRVVADGLTEHPDWSVVFYEALCVDPVGEFRRIFRLMHLRWSDAMAAFVERFSSEAKPGMYSTSRISRQQIDTWRESMAAEEVDLVRRTTSAFNLPFYYSDEDWELASFLQ